MKKIVFLFLVSLNCFSQQNSNTIRTEFMLGKSIPSYKVFTGKNPQMAIGLSYAHKNKDNSVAWQSILNNPTTGISLYYTNYGTAIKGSSISVIPFIEFHPFNNHKWSSKFGMGASYFDTKYHLINNPKNKAISSDFTWAIQGIIYYDTQLKNNFDLRFGLGVFHHSNGHLSIPNEGLNAALLSVSTSFNLKTKPKINSPDFNKSKIKKFENRFYSIRFGNGLQAFVTEDSLLKNVYTVSLNAGTYYKEIIKLNVGLGYRFYQHYYDYIKDNKTEPYIENPSLNASNIYLSVGAEVMLGYIGIDWESGVNLHKPFYRKHYTLQKTQNESKYKQKNLILGRLGLKLYAINTKKKPKNNFYLAAHINSNFGQADFSEISIGFVHRTSKKSKLPFRAF